MGGTSGAASAFIRCAVPPDTYVLDPLKKYYVFVTSACARETGAASQAFECMHNTLIHRAKAWVPRGSACAFVTLCYGWHCCLVPPVDWLNIRRGFIAAMILSSTLICRVFELRVVPV